MAEEKGFDIKRLMQKLREWLKSGELRDVEYKYKGKVVDLTEKDTKDKVLEIMKQVIERIRELDREMSKAKMEFEEDEDVKHLIKTIEGLEEALKEKWKEKAQQYGVIDYLKERKKLIEELVKKMDEAHIDIIKFKDFATEIYRKYDRSTSFSQEDLLNFLKYLGESEEKAFNFITKLRLYKQDIKGAKEMIKVEPKEIKEPKISTVLKMKLFAKYDWIKNIWEKIKRGLMWLAEKTKELLKTLDSFFDSSKKVEEVAMRILGTTASKRVKALRAEDLTEEDVKDIFESNKELLTMILDMLADGEFEMDIADEVYKRYSHLTPEIVVDKLIPYVKKYYVKGKTPEELVEEGYGRRASKIRPKIASSEIQSILFSKEEGWTVGEAKKWLKDHGYKYGDLDETEKYLRFRQKDPSKGKRKRTIEFGKGIKAIVEFTGQKKKSSIEDDFVDKNGATIEVGDRVYDEEEDSYGFIKELYLTSWTYSDEDVQMAVVRYDDGHEENVQCVHLELVEKKKSSIQKLSMYEDIVVKDIIKENFGDSIVYKVNEIKGNKVYLTLHKNGEHIASVVYERGSYVEPVKLASIEIYSENKDVDNVEFISLPQAFEETCPKCGGHLKEIGVDYGKGLKKRIPKQYWVNRGKAKVYFKCEDCGKTYWTWYD